jgi:catechol 2,3-dioxygenase-like lactoylglutathione lyase family enzyme
MQTSPAKVKVTGINQVAVVVKDLQKSMEDYWNILGIGAWDVYRWEAPLVYDRMYHGKPAIARETIAETRVGGVTIELCQPIEGNSIYRDFLTEHGEGLHHLNFQVDDVDETTELFTRQGFPCLQSGKCGPREYRGAYSYVDIPPLHTIWEPVHDPESLGVVPSRFPDSSRTSPAKVKVAGINQVAIVVKDLQKTMEDFWNILGIGAWDVYAWESPLVYDRTYHGKPVIARETIAETRVGEVTLELCQPIEGDSIYRDFLTERGEGLHHLNFQVDDVDKTTELFTRQGFPCLQSGKCGPVEEKGAYSYIDIQPLHTIWEPVHDPEHLGVTPVRFP